MFWIIIASSCFPFLTRKKHEDEVGLIVRKHREDVELFTTDNNKLKRADETKGHKIYSLELDVKNLKKEGKKAQKKIEEQKVLIEKLQGEVALFNMAVNQFQRQNDELAKEANELRRQNDEFLKHKKRIPPQPIIKKVASGGCARLLVLEAYLREINIDCRKFLNDEGYRNTIKMIIASAGKKLDAGIQIYSEDELNQKISLAVKNTRAELVLLCRKKEPEQGFELCAVSTDEEDGAETESE